MGQFNSSRGSNHLPRGWDYRNCPTARNEYHIDPTKEYSSEYYEYMTQYCTWDYFGNVGMLIDNNPLLTESEVA